MTPLEHETMDCRDCRVWEPEKIQNFDKYKNRLVMTIRNGVSLNIGHTTIPFWIDILTCSVHQAKWMHEA